MINNLISGSIGIAMVLAFLGIMIWWVKALPLIIIVLFVIGLMLYDFIQTLRFGDSSNSGR